MQEIELKFLDVDVEKITKIIESLGAQKKYEKRRIRSSVFSPVKKGELVRVRQIGEEVYMTHKAPNTSKQFKSRKETQIQCMCTYEQAIDFLESLGYESSPAGEKKRTHYELDEIHFEIDEVPGIPAYLEIETQREEDMITICEKLGLDMSRGRIESIDELYPAIHENQRHEDQA